MPMPGLQPRRGEAILRLGRRGHRLPEATGEVTAEAHAIRAHHLRRVLEVVDRAVDRPHDRVDRERMEHEAEQPTCVGQRSELVVVEVARRVVHGAAAAVRAEHGRAGRALEHLRERATGRVREVEHDAERDEAVDELAAEPRQAAAVLGRAVRERVAAVPGEPRHADAELVEEVGGPGLDAELLDALEREQQPDPLAGVDRVEVGGRPHLDDALARSRVARGGRTRPARSASRSDPSGCTATST